MAAAPGPSIFDFEFLKGHSGPGIVEFALLVLNSRLLIVDGHAYAYRAFHAIRELRSPAGQPTNAIYGFIKMLAKMRARLSPSHLIVVWDGGLSAERLAALPEYKAQRPEMPADLGSQIDEIIRYLEAANIASFCREGVEADDYIACLARRAHNADLEVVIASSDKDFMQLVTSEPKTESKKQKAEIPAPISAFPISAFPLAGCRLIRGLLAPTYGSGKVAKTVRKLF